MTTVAFLETNTEGTTTRAAATTARTTDRSLGTTAVPGTCHRTQEEVGQRGGGEEEGGGNEWSARGDQGTLLSFGKSGRDSFALDFRWPLTPMQAFGLALATMDTSL